MKNNNKKFLNFIESIKNEENKSLIECIKKAFRVVIESDDIHELKSEDRWNLITDLEDAQNNFSDTFKELNGFRPRTMTDEQWNSVEWLQSGIDEMLKEMSTPEYLEKIKREDAESAERESEYRQELELSKNQEKILPISDIISQV